MLLRLVPSRKCVLRRSSSSLPRVPLSTGAGCVFSFWFCFFFLDGRVWRGVAWCLCPYLSLSLSLCVDHVSKSIVKHTDSHHLGRLACRALCYDKLRQGRLPSLAALSSLLFFPLSLPSLASLSPRLLLSSLFSFFFLSLHFSFFLLVFSTLFLFLSKRRRRRHKRLWKCSNISK